MGLPDDPGHLATAGVDGRAGVVVLHAFWGLTDGVRDTCERLGKAGFVAWAPDLFEGETARTPDRADLLRRKKRREPTYRKGLRAVEWVAAQCAGPVGVVGFSYGGHWALWLAANAPHPLAAVVTYYATRATDVRGTPVQAHFAEQDPYVSVAARKRFEARLPPGSEVYDYPGTGHWFAERDQAAYAPRAARQAWRRTLTFLRSHTGAPRP